MHSDTPGTKAGDLGKTLRETLPSVAVKSVWRERELTRAAELRTLAAWARERTEQDPAVADALADSVDGHLAVAEDAVGMSASALFPISGAIVERTVTNLDAAEADALLLAPQSYMRGRLPDILARARTYLRAGDPRRVRLEAIALAAVDSGLRDFERDEVVAALRAANREERDTVGRARGLRRLLTVAILLVTLGALTFAVLGWAVPDALPLCFVSQEKGVLSCPANAMATARDADIEQVLLLTVSSWDILLVELVGMFAGAVAAATALRRFQTPRTSYDVPLLLALLKLPTGALSAVLGLMLLRAGLVPGFGTLDSSAQIIAWAIIFGYSQQLFTRLVDQRAQEVLTPTVQPEK
jgi:hypothetical protein